MSSNVGSDINYDIATEGGRVKWFLTISMGTDLLSINQN